MPVITEQESQDVQSLLRELASDMKESERPPIELEQRMVSAFRRQHALRWWRRAAAAGLVAASVLILVFAARFTGSRKEAPPSQTVATRGNEPAVEMTAPPGPKVRTVRTARKRRQGATKRGPAVATEFIPIAGGNIFAPIDRGHLVRVELPRSALRSFGLPMNEDRVTEAVLADVVVGEDGLARAIRFIQ